MNKALQDFKQAVANLKAAPIFQKTALAESTLAAAIRVMESQQTEIQNLKGALYGKG